LHGFGPLRLPSSRVERVLEPQLYVSRPSDRADIVAAADPIGNLSEGCANAALL